MPFGDILRGGARGLGQVAPVLGTGIGAFFGGPGGAAVGQGIGSGLGSILNYLGQPSGQQQQQQVPEIAAQQQMLQQMQQPFQGGFQPIAEEEMRRFQQDILPQLKEQLTAGGQGLGGPMAQAMGGAGQDLATRLAGLGSQYGLQERGLEQQRLGGLGQYLTGQQQLGLQAQQLAQRNRQLGQSGLAGLGGFAGQAGQLGLQRGLEGIGQEGGQAGWLAPLLSGLGRAGMGFAGI